VLEVYKSSPFRPPKRAYRNMYGFFGSISRWLYQDFMGNRAIFFLCLLFPPMWIGHMGRLLWIQQSVKPMEKWQSDLLQERDAVAFDQVVYLGGHPLAPLPEEAGLFLRSNDIHLEFRSGRELNIGFGSLGAPETFRQEKTGIFVTDQIAGMFVTSEIFHRTEYFMQVPFKDDKGFDNIVRFACGKFISPEVLSNLIISGRYHAAPPVG